MSYGRRAGVLSHVVFRRSDYRSDAIGVAVSKDGIHWERCSQNPVFQSDCKPLLGKRQKHFACFVCPKEDGWYTMFYVGADGDGVLGIGLARSRDGISQWQRHPSNPVIAGTDGSWDWRSAGKPSVLKRRKATSCGIRAAMSDLKRLVLPCIKALIWDSRDGARRRE